MADKLAKNRNYLYTLEFIHNNIYNSSYYLQYKNLAFEQPTRRSIKNICNAYNIAMWSSQHRIENTIPIATQINWNATWAYLNNNNKRSSLYTNFKLCQDKAFKIKIMLNILPTLSHLHLTYPATFSNINCISCNAHEGQWHWLTCPNTPNLSFMMNDTIQQFFNSSRLEVTNTKLQELHNKLFNHQCLALNNCNPNNTNVYTTLQRYVPQLLIQTIREYTDSNQTATNITIKFLIKLSHNIYNQI